MQDSQHSCTRVALKNVQNRENQDLELGHSALRNIKHVLIVYSKGALSDKLLWFTFRT